MPIKTKKTKLRTPTTEKNINRRIAHWHAGAGKNLELHEYLGWTKTEYAKYVRTGKVPTR